MAVAITASDYELVTQEHLASISMEIPGDGPRLLMCMVTSGSNDWDGHNDVTIVAMAEDWPTLVDVARGEGLCFRMKTDQHGSDYFGYYLVAENGKIPPNDPNFYWADDRVVVLDVPPNVIRSLKLSRWDDMMSGIERIRERSAAHVGTGPAP